ncbi:hypothetical protein SAMN04515674_1239 [Pseudarcicella hirudinis]|uniref:VOC domain-containing protein n=1 Tax=Pseudarcicella hirudinis TaxID=1079859 RepID=A0A1I5YZL2_9BACT|nr:VOC family protein [Pseudarcicella hirudinis]SFQ49708.1 hypothetical protein SAMN04515674_1239 [Pseudarcicella hirudinis]
MKRVKAIGGIFFKSKDPESIGKWYQQHLGIPVESWGGTQFEWRESDQPEKKNVTVWSPFKADTQYFEPSDKPFMINYIVEDLHSLLNVLREEGVKVFDEINESEYGKFGWILDPDGNKIELWEPPVA